MGSIEEKKEEYMNGPKDPEKAGSDPNLEKKTNKSKFGERQMVKLIKSKPVLTEEDKLKLAVSNLQMIIKNVKYLELFSVKIHFNLL